MKNVLKMMAISGSLLACGLMNLTSCGGNQNLKIVHFDQTILGSAGKDLGVSIGINKGDETLKKDLNAALATVTTEQRNTWMLNSTEASTSIDGSIASDVEKPTYVEGRPELRVGLECEYTPFNWTETNANERTYPIEGTSFYADGYDIQMAMYLAKTMEYNLTIVKLGWSALIPALQAKTINAVIAGMTDTEERRQSIDFTDEYYRSELVLVVKESGSFASATSLSDFSGAKIVSQKETVTNSIIDDWVKEYNVQHLNAMDTFATCATSVQSGSADAMTAELPVATSIVNGMNR